MAQQFHFWAYTQKNPSNSKIYMHPNVHYSTICNSKDMESESESHSVMSHS